jgi:hypothetical protein
VGVSPQNPLEQPIRTVRPIVCISLHLLKGLSHEMHLVAFHDMYGKGTRPVFLFFWCSNNFMLQKVYFSRLMRVHLYFGLKLIIHVIKAKASRETVHTKKPLE